MESQFVAYIGNTTNKDNDGITICDVSTEEGSLRFRRFLPLDNAAHLRRSVSGRYLYSITNRGVACFGIEADGDLRPENTLELDGMRGRHLTTDSAGRFLFMAGWHDGKITVIGTDPAGRLTGVLEEVFHRGTGQVTDRSFTPHVSCVRVTPDDLFLCAVDSGLDQVRIYEIRDDGKLRERGEVRCLPDSAPRRIHFGRDGRFAYLLNELSNTVDVLSYEVAEDRPVFERIQSVSTTSDNVDRLHDAASGLCLSGDGQYLFTSTAGDDTVAMFRVDTETGLLEKRFALPVSGVYPKHIALFPDGAHIACANNGSNAVTTFAVDHGKDLLIMKGRPVAVESPSCILIEAVEG